MRKIDWVLVIVPLFATWGIDRITKMWALTLQGLNFHGPLGFVLHHNHGAMLGLFSDITPVIRVVSLSTGGAFLLFFFVIIQYLLPIKSMKLRAGLSILLGGILGNVTDRVIYGHVIDFILVGSPEKASPAFNMADALQWVGYAMIATALIRESEVLWPEKDTRKFKWVNLRFQLRYCFILMAVGLGFAAIAGVYSYTFLRVTIIDFGGYNTRVLDSYLIPFIVSFLCVSLVFSAVLFLIGRILSARIAGPLYAFEKFLDDLAAGKPRQLRLRAGDEFRHLEGLAARLTKHLESQGAIPQPASSVAEAGSEDFNGPSLPITELAIGISTASSAAPSSPSPEAAALSESLSASLGASSSASLGASLGATSNVESITKKTGT